MNSAEPKPGGKKSAFVACALIVVTALGGLCWISALPLLGFDAYPLIASSGVKELGDLWRLVSIELMDGRYPDGHFHRPLVQLSFALDRALHGLEPRGYHLTNLLVCAISGTLVFGLARRIGGLKIWSACVAGLFFVAHPLQAEVLPFPARRADNLALCLTLAVLLMQVRPGAVLGRGRAVGLCLLSWCAFAAKETGAVVALLGPLLLLIEGEGTLARRFKSAMRNAWPTILGVALGVGTRHLVLGGLAGHTDSSLLGSLTLPASEYLWRLLYSQPWAGWNSATLPILWGLFAMLMICGLKSRPQGTGFLFAWLIALLMVSGLAGRVHDWYALLFVPAMGILVCVVIEKAWVHLHADRTPTKAVPGILALGLALSLLVNGPLLQRYGNLIDGGKMLEQSLVQVDRLVANAQVGTTTRLNPWIPLLPPHSDGSELRGVALTSDYSLQAYVELLRPELNTRVRRYEAAVGPGESESWTLELVQQPLPSWIRRH
ncbi:MAG: hypothetical protein CMJ86_09520 [Planctomycetes bacterium]|nr:hypothetical protein [Planctomycetota bacterium]